MYLTNGRQLLCRLSRGSGATGRPNQSLQGTGDPTVPGQKVPRAVEGLTGDLWQRLFELADKQERQARAKCELVPYWHVETDDIKIERVIPFYPYSSDQARLAKILKTLAVYRLALGQPRQAELVEHLLEHDFDEGDMKQILEHLMVDLSPINYKV